MYVYMCVHVSMHVRLLPCGVDELVREYSLDNLVLCSSMLVDIHPPRSVQMQKWIHEKMQTACDESHKDPTDLIGKLQKHQAFEAELSANKTTVEEVCKVCVCVCVCVKSSDEGV